MRANEDPEPINLITLSTENNILEQLNAYYFVALRRCEPIAARNVAINRLKGDLDELFTTWELSKT